MNIYTCTDFKGFYPVGTSAVVAAPTEEQAHWRLSKALAAHGLEQDKRLTLSLFATDADCHEKAVILQDGNY